MTICIAAVCADGKAVVVAADRMVSAAHLSAEFEHPSSKIDPITSSCVGLTAGDALASTELFRHCAGPIGQQNSPTIEMVSRCAKESFASLRMRRAEDQLLAPRGMTIQQFYGGGGIHNLPPEIAFGIDRDIARSELPLEVIIAGMDSSGAHIYGIHDPGVVHCFDWLGYHAIGSGMNHALLVTIANDHSATRSVNETAYLVYEAKARSEVAPGVGHATDMAIISSAGIKTLSIEELQSLDSIYRSNRSPQQEATRAAIAALPFEKERAVYGT